MSNLRFSPRPNRAHEISWRPWGEPAFREAQADDLPVLLSISAVWCHWCHVMDETSYSDLENIRIINQRFIPIRVDSDQRPDINARYNLGGWPTTAFLTPQGEVITGATYMPPSDLKAALLHASDAYGQQKGMLLQRVQELQERRRSSSARAGDRKEPDATIVDIVSRAVAAAYDPRYGGFGTEPKFPMVSSVELLLHMYQSTGDLWYRLMVEKTLDNMMRGGLYDHEADGFFRYSTTRDWSVPHFEKMLEDNVGLLKLYVRTYLTTGNDSYASVASRIVDYLNSSLSDASTGAFYGSQDADDAYYSLSRAQRVKQRPPGVDPTFYTGLNATVASAYLEAAWALNRPELGDVALGTLEYILARRRENHLRHSYEADGGAGIPALLSDYTCLVIAFVDAYDQTSLKRYLDEAEDLAEELTEVFGDSEGDGFFDIPEDLKAVGNLKLRAKPIAENVLGIEALGRLFYSTRKGEYREAANAALSAFVPTYREYGEAAAGYALAVDRFLHQPLEVNVIGLPGDSNTKALITAAATIPYPNTAIKFMDARDRDRLSDAGYWAGEGAQAYVCMETVCLPPIGDPKALRHTVAELIESPTSGNDSIIRELGRAG